MISEPPAKKSFDCVAYMREQRDRISRKLNSMNSEQRVAWLRSLEPTHPSLKRLIPDDDSRKSRQEPGQPS